MKTYTPQEAGEILGVSKQTIHNWIGAKKIKHEEINIYPVEYIKINAREIKRLKRLVERVSKNSSN